MLEIITMKYTDTLYFKMKKINILFKRLGHEIAKAFYLYKILDFLCMISVHGKAKEKR